MTRNRTRCFVSGSAFLAIAAALVWCVPARATSIAFSDFGPNQSFDSLSSYTLNSNTSHGFLFTSAASGAVSQIDVAIDYVAGPTSSFVMSLYTNLEQVPAPGNGWVPDVLGSLLGSYSGTPMPSGSTGPPSLVTPGPAVSLVAGQEYWLVASVPVAGSELQWQFNNIGLLGSFYLNSGGVPTYASVLNNPINVAAFEITVSPVPEPSAAMLAMVGGMFMLSLRRRHK